MNSNNDDEMIDRNYFYEKDYENKLCVDCQAAQPEYVSINNAVLLCKSCSDVHNKLGHSISYIRKIDEGWDRLLLNFMDRGGNNRLLRFTRQHGIAELPIEIKYTIRFMQYYRLVIKSEVFADEPPEEPTKEQGMQKGDVDIDYFPEFAGYELYKGSVDVNGRGSMISEGIKKGSSTLYNVISTTGSMIFSATKPVASFFGSTTMKGMGYAFSYLTGWNQSTTPTESGCKDEKKEETKEIKKDEEKQKETYNYDYRKNNYPSVSSQYNPYSYNSTALPSNLYNSNVNTLLRKPRYVTSEPYQIKENTILYDYEVRKEEIFEPKCQFINTNKRKARKEANNILLNQNK